MTLSIKDPYKWDIVSNCRPITLLNIVLKVIIKVLARRFDHVP